MVGGFTILSPKKKRLQVRHEYLAKVAHQHRHEYLAKVAYQQRHEYLAKVAHQHRHEYLAKVAHQQRHEYLAKVAHQQRHEYLAKVAYPHRHEYLAKVAHQQRKNQSKRNKTLTLIFKDLFASNLRLSYTHNRPMHKSISTRRHQLFQCIASTNMFLNCGKEA